MRYDEKTVFLALPLLLVAGCCQFGTVDQGRVVAYDKAAGLVTIVGDAGRPGQGGADYSRLPPVVYRVPEDPSEMGPEPRPGLRLALDPAAKQLVLFEPATQSLRVVNYTLVDQKQKVGRDSPLLFDAATRKPRPFPVVDREKKTITVYSARQELLLTFSVPADLLALADSTWEAGDEVRIYTKQPGKASRMMNVTRTDIFRK